MNITLLTCPFCGTKAALRVASRLGNVDNQGYRNTEHYVFCDPKTHGSVKGCGAQGAGTQSWDEAVLRWNRRMPEIL